MGGAEAAAAAAAVARTARTAGRRRRRLGWRRGGDAGPGGGGAEEGAGAGADLRRTDAARRVVRSKGDGRAPTRLGEAVALAHTALEDGLHVLLHLNAERRRAREHELDAAAQQLLRLLEAGR